MNADDPLAAGSRLHFMGIGGIGMSALARLAHARGFRVDGCDRSDGPAARALRAMGIPVSVGHDAGHVAEADGLVYTSATPADHPERRAARNAMRRGTFLARLMDATGPNLGVAGTHGKTSTTWLLAHLLIEAGFDPSVALGGTVSRMGGNCRIGAGPFVAELDESDGSFLEPRVDLAVVANVESDHLSHYGTDEALRAAFRTFADRVAARGTLFVNLDDPGAAALLDGPGRRVGFGFGSCTRSRAWIFAEETGLSPNGRRFRLFREGVDVGGFLLPLPGKHNLSNALGALAAALAVGVRPESAAGALAGAPGVDRRLQRLGEISGTAVYTDYAHHPSEIRAGLAALREMHPGGVCVAFQPHLFSRTRDYADDFGRVLAEADEALVVDIYPAREAPIPGVTSQLLVDAIRARDGKAQAPAALADVADWVRGHAGKRPGDAIALMGAGDIGGVASTLFPEHECSPS